MTDIELRNENGKIVGYDLETGEKVPVSYEDLVADSADISGTTKTGALEAEDADITGTFSFDGNAITETADIGDVDSGGLPDFWHVAEDDAALDDVMTDLSDGDVIWLGPSQFTQDRTFSNRIEVVGSTAGTSGSNIGNSSVWTFEGLGSKVRGCYVSDGGTLRFEGSASMLVNSNGYDTVSHIEVAAEDVRLVNIRDYQVVFESGATGVVGPATDSVSVSGDGTWKEVAYQ